jgi:hypothetical protein
MALAGCKNDIIDHYRVLSYVWGLSDECSAISVNKQTLKVTANFFQALRDLQAKHGVRRLWIDAICIDQENLQERARQIRKMRGIYTLSFAAVGWLGEEKDGSAQALDLLDRLASFHDPVDDFRAKELVDRIKGNHR